MKYVTMQFNILSLLTLFLLTCCYGDQKVDTDTYLSGFIADLWLEGGDVMRIIWRDCSKKLVDVKDVIDHKEYFPKFVRCMKRKTLRALDRSLTPDVVQITDGVNLVRFELVDKTGNVMPENETSTWTEKELEDGDWRSLALQRMAKVIRTHVIKFDFEDGKTTEKVEFRGRRRHHMMTMMMFGIVSIGMVLVPMGFQFLAMLGGKALLLAKMALVMASIQGLRKVGANPVNYGLYPGYPYDHYERRSRNDWPPPSVIATPPPSMAVDDPWIDQFIKTDRIHIAQDRKDLKDNKKVEAVIWKPEIPKPVKVSQSSEPRFYPIYNEPSSPAAVFTSLDAPTPLLDFTTRPGDVQADYALELPFNRFRFQSPTTVIST